MPPKTKTTSLPVSPAPRAARMTTPARPIDQERVAAIAYRLFEERGGEHGHDAEDWFRAEQIVRAEQAARDTAR